MLQILFCLNYDIRQRGMNILIALVAIAGLVPNPGCRSARDNQIDILERELRSQEDYIYELEDYIVEYSEKLRQYRCAQLDPVATGKPTSEPELAAPLRTEQTSPASEAPRLRDSIEERSQDLDEPAMDDLLDESPENLEVPDLEIGSAAGEFDPYASATPLAEADIEGDLLADGSFIPDPAAFQTALREETADYDLETADEEQLFDEDVTPTRSRDPERLIISHVFRNSDPETKPTSLLSVVEARDASNEPADFNGKVSLMVMTVTDGKPQRVKRWDFTAEETNAAWQSSNLGDGLHLELPLEGTELPNGLLELWVRLETVDGRKLLSQAPFEGTTLASIDEAAEYVADTGDEIGGATHLAETNPLRQTATAIKTEPIRDEPEPINVAAVAPQPERSNKSKAEPQWRAATHYSSGANTGFATTATAQQWSTRPIGNKALPPAEQPVTKGQQQQWRSRRK